MAPPTKLCCSRSTFPIRVEYSDANLSKESFSASFLTCICLCCVGCFLLLTGIGNASDHASRPSETLLPDTTQGFFAISNVDTLREHWNNTQLGHLMADPVMEPFTKDVRRQFEDRWSSVHERLGLTLDDMKGVPGGDVGIGLVCAEARHSGVGHRDRRDRQTAQCQRDAAKSDGHPIATGRQTERGKVEGCPDVVVQFDLPELEEEKEASRSTLRGSEKERNRQGRGKAEAEQKIPKKLRPAGILLSDGKPIGCDRQF